MTKRADYPVAADATLAAVDDPIEQGRFTRWVQGEAGEALAESSLQLGGLHCAACAGIIEQALRRVPGVRSVRVSAAAQRASVCWDPSRTKASALLAAVHAAGYAAVPDAAEAARALRRTEARQALWRLFVAGFCAMQVMMFATPSYVTSGDELAPDMARLLNWGSWLLSLPVLAFSAWPFFRGAWNTLRARRIGMDVPVALGMAITFVGSSGATFAPGGVFGHEVYFDSFTMFVAFLLGGRWFEMRVRHRATDALEASLAHLPAVAWRLDEAGQAQAVSVHRLRRGDLVQVPVGEAFPADGELLGPATRADESLLSGESRPIDKASGDAVVAGSINLGAPARMRVQRVGADTRFEAIVSMMRSASTQRPALARLADRWAAPFLWAVLLLAAGAAAAWSVIDPSRALWVAVAVLIVTCPCALSLAAPATLVAAAHGLARRGVLVQRLDAIEVLARAQQVFLDKTGTLTTDHLQLRSVRVLGAGDDEDFDADAATRRAAALAANSNHPLSRALVQAAGASVTAAEGVREHAGLGLEWRDEAGQLWRLGAPRWVQEGRQSGDDAASAGRVELGVQGRAIAAFDFDEALRPGAEHCVAELLGAGLRVTLLTGDAPARAHALAERLGIADVRAEATPESKLAALAAAQAEGRTVAMVGDGVNDAPVLARADVSIAMGQGAMVSRAHADAVLVSGDLAELARARTSAVRALRIVRQNLVWAAGYNGLCIPLALAGWLPPWAAGLGMAASSLAVVLNATRAAR